MAARPATPARHGARSCPHVPAAIIARNSADEASRRRARSGDPRPADRIRPDGRACSDLAVERSWSPRHGGQDEGPGMRAAKQRPAVPVDGETAPGPFRHLFMQEAWEHIGVSRQRDFASRAQPSTPGTEHPGPRTSGSRDVWRPCDAARPATDGIHPGSANAAWWTERIGRRQPSKRVATMLPVRRACSISQAAPMRSSMHHIPSRHAATSHPASARPTLAVCLADGRPARPPRPLAAAPAGTTSHVAWPGDALEPARHILLAACRPGRRRLRSKPVRTDIRRPRRSMHCRYRQRSSRSPHHAPARDRPAQHWRRESWPIADLLAPVRPRAAAGRTSRQRRAGLSHDAVIPRSWYFE
jgi:hypothetical protein